jgi:hypothetical protein
MFRILSGLEGELCGSNTPVLWHVNGGCGNLFSLESAEISAVNLAGFSVITDFGPESRRPTYVVPAYHWSAHHWSLISAMNSARVADWRRKTPRMALVTVRLPGFFTPRMVIHK